MDPQIVAVGETGLDYYWDEPDRGIQKYWFGRQLELARGEKASCHPQQGCSQRYI